MVGVELEIRDDMSDADAHVALATSVIVGLMTPESGTTRWDVRRFWRDNADERERCGLSKAQTDLLICLCQTACEPLPEGDRPADWVDAKSKGRRRPTR